MSSTTHNQSDSLPAGDEANRKAGASWQQMVGRLRQWGRKVARLAGRLDRRWVALLVVVAVAAALWPALVSHARSHTATLVESLPVLRTVAAAPVLREDLFNEVTIPAEFRPYAEVSLHAKVSGFVQSISVDIGDHVKAGQLLATLEIPELKDE